MSVRPIVLTDRIGPVGVATDLDVVWKTFLRSPQARRDCSPSRQFRLFDRIVTIFLQAPTPPSRSSLSARTLTNHLWIEGCKDAETNNATATIIRRELCGSRTRGNWMPQWDA